MDKPVRETFWSATSMPRPNCAIQYIPEAFEGDKVSVVGRQSAGAGFLDALIRHGGVERLWCLTDSEQDYAAFQARVAATDGSAETAWIRPFDADAMAAAGCMFMPGPLIGEGAWMRRFAGERHYSICGITHSVATERVIRSIRDFMVAPTQPWDALICTSVSARDAILQIFDGWAEYLKSRGFGVAKVPVQFPIIPLGVHLDRFERSEAALQRGRALREKLGVRPEDILVLHFGRHDFRSKAHPTPLFRALELARRRYRKSRLHLLMVGQFSDPVNANQFEAARRLFAPGVPVHWIDGAHTDLANDAWPAADIFVSLPDNVQESFGLTPVEAMAASLPCVVSDWNGYKETVVDGETGIRIPTTMAPAGAGVELADAHACQSFDHFTLIAYTAQCTAVDIDACARAIATLAEDAGLRERMGRAGRARAEMHYDWRRIIAQYQSLWADLAHLRRAGPAVGARDPRRQTVHPDYPDLFSMFARHPTRTLSDRARVRLADPDARYSLRQIRSLMINDYANPVMLPAAAIDDLVEQLERGPLSVAELLGAGDAAQRHRILRSLVWLGKFGVVNFD